MLSKEDNELISQVGPGTPMGDLMRQYWIPFMPTTTLAEPDGKPQRVRLLGEELIAFRDTNGAVGLVAANCPHRGAPMYFARNEACGMRCVYHGWKFDTTGKCVDMPNEPEESNFKDKVRIKAYPTHEVNGLIWTYLGPRETPPDFPLWEVTTLPPENVYPPHIMMEECNWMQALEGDIDSSHIDWVHGRLHAEGTGRGTFNQDKRPRLEVLPTEYGACYSACRTYDEQGNQWHRITQWIMPFFTMIAAGDPTTVTLRAWVPLDDHYNMLISVRGRLDRPVTEQERQEGMDPFAAFHGYVEPTSDPTTRWYTKANMHNDYLHDWTLQKEELVFGVPFVGNLQDRAMTEGMGWVYDRTNEHLGTTDAMVIYVRRRLIGDARALREQGTLPGNVEDAKMARIRSASIVLPSGESWIAATEEARKVDAGVPIAWLPLSQA